MADFCPLLTKGLQMRQSWAASHNVPISMAQRAGDLVLTSAYGPWTFDPRDVTFDEDGNPVTDGSGLEGTPFDEQVHRTFDHVKAALGVAGCSLEDVVECRCWLADPRHFVRFNEIYSGYFKKNHPVRTVFPSGFMFNCLVEIQAVAYKPLRDG
jgi:2-iminobutanoate/2-iminopropanoate deaminase